MKTVGLMSLNLTGGLTKQEGTSSLNMRAFDNLNFESSVQDLGGLSLLNMRS